LRTLIHSFYFTQVTISLNIIYSHLSFRHIEPCKYGRRCVTHDNLIYDLARCEPSIAQWLEHPTGILKGHRFDSHWVTQKFIFQSNLTQERFLMHVPIKTLPLYFILKGWIFPQMILLLVVKETSSTTFRSSGLN